MPMKYYLNLIQPYADNISEFLENRLVAYVLLILIACMGLMLILFPRKMNRLIVYNHTSLFLAVICWYILSKRDFSKSSYFFIGTCCTHLTYFINVGSILNENICILLFLTIFYFPILDVLYEMDGILLLTCFVFSLMVLIMKKRLFLALGVIFMGSCMIVGSMTYLFTGKLLEKYTFLGIFVVYSLGLLFNYYMKKEVLVEGSNQIVDGTSCK